MYEIR